MSLRTIIRNMNHHTKMFAIRVMRLISCWFVVSMTVLSYHHRHHELYAFVVVTHSRHDARTVAGIGSTTSSNNNHDRIRLHRRFLHMTRMSSSPLQNEKTFPPTTTAPQTQQQQRQQRPLPAMPSMLFQQLAYSQMELLASSLVGTSPRSGFATASTSSYSSSAIAATMNTKSKSIVLYLPQENRQTGQLEFLPMIIYPYQNERIFIANAWNTGIPPIIPNVITKLPGFAHATTLLPRYPMIYTSRSYSNATDSSGTVNPSRPQQISEPGIGRVEEVYCDWRAGTITSLSVPLLIGSQTVGVLLVSPQQQYTATSNTVAPFWTEYDRQQVSRAATSLSLALSMDNERQSQERRDMEMEQQKQFYNSLSDNLHQLKNPIQALRTYGKLLQRRLVEISKIANDTTTSESSIPPEDIDKIQLLELADHLMKQSERIVERLKPVDTIIAQINNSHNPSVLALLPSAPITQQQSIVPYIPRTLQRDDSSTRPSWEVDTTTYRSDPSIATVKSEIWSDAATASLKTDGGCGGNSNIDPLFEERKEMAFVLDVLEPIFRDFHTIATEQDIEFHVMTDDIDNIPGVSIYPKALQEVLVNLLDNAFKYVIVADHDVDTTRRHDYHIRRPQVRVRIYPNELDKGISNGIDMSHRHRPGVTIIVEDNGLGIAINDTERIFERGYRNEQISRQTHGSGIGLAIAKSYVQYMGGTLRTILHEGHQERPRRRRSSSLSTTTAASLPYLSGAVMELILFR